MNVTAIRQAMNSALAEISSAIYVYDLAPKEPQIVPCLIVWPPDQIDYYKTRNLSIAVFPVTALVGPQDASGQVVLEGLMSDTGSVSVMAKLYEDRTLGGVVSNLRLLDSSSGLYPISIGGDNQVIGCEFRVEVSA